MNSNIKNILNKLKSKIYFDYDVGKLTWFRTGGNAKIYALVESQDDLEIILSEFKNENIYVIGAGSNILVRDKGFDGIILKLGEEFNNIKISESKLEVGASLLDINLSNFALKNSIANFEFFSGIPGTVGGAVKMNAGCFGSETKDNIHSIEFYDSNFEKKTIFKNEINLSYRSSNINDNQIISKIYFDIKFGNKHMIKENMIKIKKKRLSSQPIVNKTSGSTFKNPPSLYAAKLIEESGCKGMTYGDASVSMKHANFFINNGKASAKDLESLGEMVINKVYSKFNIKLDWEVKIIGEQ